MKTLMDKQKNVWIKKFHMLLRQAGINNELKMEMLSSYGVRSSKDLDLKDLIDLCEKLDRIIHPSAVEMDKWRKRLIAAIFEWRNAMGDKPSMDEVKGIACRAAGQTAEKKGFNAIPLERLRSLYYAFVNKTKDLRAVEQLTKEELDYKTSVN